VGLFFLAIAKFLPYFSAKIPEGSVLSYVIPLYGDFEIPGGFLRELLIDPLRYYRQGSSGIGAPRIEVED
jgi:hypothetical protein